MMLSKLSIFVVATLAASALATAVNSRDFVVSACSTGLRCCSYLTNIPGLIQFNTPWWFCTAGQNQKKADGGDALLVHAKLGVDISLGSSVWTNCPIRVTNWYGHLSFEWILCAILICWTLASRPSAAAGLQLVCSCILCRWIGLRKLNFLFRWFSRYWLQRGNGT